jgi:hypothetical protein
MKTGETVMDEKKLTDAEIGQIYRKTGEIIRRINDGTIGFKKSIKVIQKIIIEGHANEHLQVVNGWAEINVIKNIIDTDATPFIPQGLLVEKHIGYGLWSWNSDLIEYFLSKEQEESFQNGNRLRKVIESLRNKKLLNANILDYLLTNSGLIPESWKDKNIFFWGTIYGDDAGDFCVRYLYWSDSKWDWGRYWLNLDYNFNSDDPAVFIN